MKPKKAFIQLTPFLIIIIIVGLGIYFGRGQLFSISPFPSDFLNYYNPNIDSFQPFNIPESIKTGTGYSCILRDKGENNLFQFQCPVYACANSNSNGAFLSNIAGTDVLVTDFCSGIGGDYGEIDLWTKKDFKGADVNVNLLDSEHHSADNYLNCGTGSKIGIKDIKTYAFIGGCKTPTSFLFEVKSSIKNPDDIFIYQNGQFIEQLNLAGKPLLISFPSDSKISSIEYKLPYSCLIDDFSQPIMEDFSNDFSIKDLTYEPLRFCLDLPFVIRSFSEQGLRQDIRGELMQDLKTGKTISFSGILGCQNGCVIRTTYITKFVNEMEVHCNLYNGEAYNPKTKSCEKVVTQETPTQEIIQCKTINDCWMPSKCGNVNVNCVLNKCIYNSNECTPEQIEKIVVNEKLVYQEILKEVQSTEILPVIMGTNSFSYTQKYNTPPIYIGSSVFSAENPKYTGSYFNIPQGYVSDTTKYEVTISYKGQNYILKHNQPIMLNKYLEVKWLFGGRGVAFLDQFDLKGQFRNQEDWINTFIFTFKSKDFLTPIAVEDDKFILLNEIHNIPFKLNNDFDDFEGGIRLKTKTDLFEKITLINKRFIEGNNKYYLNLPTSELGTMNVEIIPYITIKADNENIIFSDTSFNANYRIVADKSLIQQEKTIPSIKTTNFLSSFWQSIINFIKRLFSRV